MRLSDVGSSALPKDHGMNILPIIRLGRQLAETVSVGLFVLLGSASGNYVKASDI